MARRSIRIAPLPDPSTRWSWLLPAVIDPEPLPDIDLPLPIRSLLMRRGLQTGQQVLELLDPPELPDPADAFPDLPAAVSRVVRACRNHEAIAICGDYDADGMTSTALLLRALTPLGAQPTAAIPSRMEDGYGLNPRMVEDLHERDIRLLITVDNGVAATEALTRAQELGMEVIVTDHHSIPEQRPPMAALIHPSTTPLQSPYRGLAGVGLAFVLAAAVADHLERKEAIASARDLFCIGTIADMAPLTGANRRWLLEGLQHLHRSECAGLIALQRLAGLESQPLQSEDIGFQIAPRINAVGRLGEPKLVVDLLTAREMNEAMGLARRCDDCNRQRRELCNAIEAEAIALVDADEGELPPFLLIAQNHWHHGVIGIVAARLVERYHRPAALLAGEGNGRLRASVRAPAGFAVDSALKACGDILERFGGHPAAGGFTVSADHVHTLHARLNALAETWLRDQGTGIPVKPEALLNLEQLTWSFWDALQRLAPFGVGNPSPLFWARGCSVVEHRKLSGGHLSFVLEQDGHQRRAIAWRWKSDQPVPERCDVAFHVTVHHWQGEKRLQLDVKALRQHHEEITLMRGDRIYRAMRVSEEDLCLSNADGQQILATARADHQLFSDDPRAQNPMVKQLLEEACLGLGIKP